MLRSLILSAVSLVALGQGAALATTQDRPMFAVQPGLRPNTTQPTKLPTWVLKWTYKSKPFSAIFVGTDPSAGASTTIPTYIIPIKLTSGTFVTDPTKAGKSGVSPVAATVASPIFDATTDYKQGGTDLGATQYVDAFQRAALWGTVSAQTGYHVLLGKPTIEPVQSFTVPPAQGKVGTVFGMKVIEANINWMDKQIQTLLTKLKIPADSLPIFVTTQTFLTQGGCCIGGYHSYNGTQAYSHFTFIQKSGVFAQDVSALSHEVSEWMDDPLTNNTKIPALCGQTGNQIYEVGDPLEGDANYGDYPYVVKGVTYHLQDEVLPTYFGAPTSTTVNGWSTLQGTKIAVCSKGG